MRRIFLTLFLLAAVTANATIVVTGLGPEREFAYGFLSRVPSGIKEKCLQIRVEAIEDPQLIEALRKGAKTRNIYLLLDRPTELVLKLSALRLKRLHIRWTSPLNYGLSQGEKNKFSFTMSVGDAYHSWSGPNVWRKELFAKQAVMVVESGAASWQTSPLEAKDFIKEFNQGILLD